MIDKSSFRLCKIKKCICTLVSGLDKCSILYYICRRWAGHLFCKKDSLKFREWFCHSAGFFLAMSHPYMGHFTDNTNFGCSFPYIMWQTICMADHSQTLINPISTTCLYMPIISISTTISAKSLTSYNIYTYVK